jgi:hypothetical protein
MTAATTSLDFIDRHPDPNAPPEESWDEYARWCEEMALVLDAEAACEREAERRRAGEMDAVCEGPVPF